MFCEKCGNQIPDDARFCNKCGAKICGDDSGDVMKNNNVPQDTIINVTDNSLAQNPTQIQGNQSTFKRKKSFFETTYAIGATIVSFVEAIVGIALFILVILSALGFLDGVGAQLGNH